jgi:hypothetical protein
MDFCDFEGYFSLEGLVGSELVVVEDVLEEFILEMIEGLKGCSFDQVFL